MLVFTTNLLSYTVDITTKEKGKNRKDGSGSKTLPVDFQTWSVIMRLIF
jgi:hypothetical protein